MDSKISMTLQPLCMAMYDRQRFLASDKPVNQYCQRPANHHGSHSWDELRLADMKMVEQDTPLIPTAVEPCEDEVDIVARHAAAITRNIDNGTYDPYIEMILAAGHDRKRALRGVRGFPSR